MEKPRRLIARDWAAVQNALTEFGNARVVCYVNQFHHHG
jgi:hypothetical protein